MLKSEREGFAITMEVMLATLFIVMATSLFLWATQVAQSKAFFNEIFVSSANMAARYGGSDSLAYKIQTNSTGSIEDSANNILNTYTNLIVRDENRKLRTVFNPVGGKYITISSKPDSNGQIKVSMSYKLGNYLFGGYLDSYGIGTDNYYGVKNVEMRMHSLMQRGALLNGQQP